jgi:hypothetical protein
VLSSAPRTLKPTLPHDEPNRAFDQHEHREPQRLTHPKHEHRRRTGRCQYCGQRCPGRVCAEHRDLPQLDGRYDPATSEWPAGF